MPFQQQDKVILTQNSINTNKVILKNEEQDLQIYNLVKNVFGKKYTNNGINDDHNSTGSFNKSNKQNNSSMIIQTKLINVKRSNNIKQLQKNDQKISDQIIKKEEKSQQIFNLIQKIFEKKPITNQIYNDENSKVIYDNKLKQYQNTFKINKKVTNIKKQKIGKKIDIVIQQSSNQIIKNVELNENIKRKVLKTNQPLCQEQKYIKMLKQLVPKGKTLISTINRQRTCLSLQLRLIMNNQQMFRYQKGDNFLQPIYQIYSQGKNRTYKVGYMKCDILGSIFNIYQHEQNNKKGRLVGTINYQQKFKLKSGPRYVEMYIIKNNLVKIKDQNKSKSIHENNLKIKFQIDQGENITKFVNVKPQLNQNNQYSLDFKVNDRILPSIKNIVLVQYQTNQQALKLYKVQNNTFKLKVKDNLSAFISYCFVVSSLMFKWVSQ